MPKPNDREVVVVGGGPAGLAATAELAALGVRVACVNPVQPPRWPNTYGIWADELEAVGLSECARHTWSTPRVELGEGRSHRLDREYALIDNDRLRETLVERAEGENVRWREGTAEATEQTAEGGIRLRLRDGDSIEADVVIDATGHRPSLVGREAEPAPSFQTAYGIVAECAESPCAPDEMILMDFRTDHLPDRDAVEGPPTFLYVMEVDEGRYLLEETALSARPPVPYHRLEERLRARFESRGLEAEPETFERVRIPMGLALPSPGRRTLPFGGAASMVHPATGYMVGRTLRSAPALAEALATELEAGRPDRAVEAGWRAVWPRTLRRARELLQFGNEALLEMDAPQTAAFFEAFFDLETEDWSAYMSGRSSASRVARTMWRVFGAIDLGLRGRLARTALSRHGRHLFRSVTR